ncbi:MAG: hypothetical protein QOI77_204, partial [Blastocatellia bacterium]|nr:hypothetical protein [Blastocatellia bacterium]
SKKRNFNRNAVEDNIAVVTQGSRSGNPGLYRLEVVAPLGPN